MTRRSGYLCLTALAACAVSPEPGSPEATLREVVAGDEWLVKRFFPCEEVSAELLHTEAEWDARMAELLPETYESGRLPSSLVDWTSETALIGYADCGTAGIILSLSDIDEGSDGEISVEYETELPTNGSDIMTRTYLIHAFASCGDCALASVTTSP